jgi:hypothetical protein
VNGYAAFQPGAELSLVAKVYTAYSFTDRYSAQQLFHHFHDGKIRVWVYAKVTRESMDCLIVHVFDNWGRTLYQICPKPVIPDWRQVSLDVNLRFIVCTHVPTAAFRFMCPWWVCVRTERNLWLQLLWAGVQWHPKPVFWLPDYRCGVSVTLLFYVCDWTSNLLRL